MSWPEFTSRLSEIGWAHKDVDMHEPGVQRPDARRIHLVFYVGVD